jgi:guanyl-specific ribonuclease Sa
MLAYPGESPYSYAGNNPLVYKDPSGLYMIRRWESLGNSTPGDANFGYVWHDVSVYVRGAAGFSGSGPQGGAGIINVGGLYNGGGGEGASESWFEGAVRIFGEFNYGFWSAVIDDAFHQNMPKLSGRAYLWGRNAGHAAGFFGSAILIGEGAGFNGGAIATTFGLGVGVTPIGAGVIGFGAHWGINAAGNMEGDLASLVNSYNMDAAGSGGGKGSSDIPDEAHDVLSHIEAHNGAAPKGYKGGRTFKNTEGRLPSDGTYQEYDIHPYTKGINRGKERIVRDSKSGKAWYTSDHYDTFIPMN